MMNDEDDLAAYQEYVAADQPLDTADWNRRIEAAVQRAIDLEDEVEALTERAKQLAAARRYVVEETLPNLLREIKQDAATIHGCKLKMKHEVAEATLAADKNPKRDQALAWLTESGNGDIVRTQVVAQVDKGQDQLAQQIIDDLRRQHPDVLVKGRRDAHPSSVAALLNARLRAGQKTPLELFNARVVHRVHIKRPGAKDD
jgi:hypothetical protein